MINIERFNKNINSIGKIGQTDNGLKRLAFSDEYYESINQLEAYAVSKGYVTHIDKVGNLFIEYNPNNKDECIMIGSHMDTVKSGGLYDGALGVFAGLEVIESLKDNGTLLDNYGLIVVAFNAEEGSEMGGTFGSRTICDRNNLDDPELLRKAMIYNLTKEDLEDSKFDLNNISAFIELHIEQGAFLEDNNYDIGIVDGIVGITRYDLHIYGTSNHAGTTPMSLRDDPIKKLPKIIEKMYEEANCYEHPFVMTIGDIRVKPGMYNVIPNEATLLLEVRDINQENIDNFFNSVERYLKEKSLYYELVNNIIKLPADLNSNIINIAKKSAEELEYKTIIMSSGAGHDAKEMNYKVPTGMIFIPSIGGISHSPEEFSSIEQIEKGINVLYNTVLNLDREGV